MAMINNRHERKKKIAFLMHGCKNVGGGEHSIYFLIKNLHRDIFEPVVFYAHENEIINRLRVDGIRLVRISLNEKIVSVYRDGINKKPWLLLTRLFYLLTGIYHIAGRLKDNKIDLLHPHDNLSKVLGGVAAGLLGIKVVVHCRDALKNDLTGKMLRISYRLFTDRVIAVSGNTMDTLCDGNELLLRKTTVIYNGVDLNVFDPDRVNGNLKGTLNIHNGKLIISIIAVLEEYKGHNYLFQAIKLLKQNGTINFTCLVIGDGRERDRLIQNVRNENIEEFVVFLNHRNDIPELLGITDVLVIPSIAQEAFPRIAIEAMAMRVPVVCTDFGGLPEAVINGETGIVVPVRDPFKLYKALEYMIRNPEMRVKMGESGAERVADRFSIKNNVSQTEKIYSEILS